MKNVTVRLADEKVDELDDESDAVGVSRAEYLRRIIESRDESDAVKGESPDKDEIIDELEATVSNLESDLSMMQSQYYLLMQTLSTTNQQVERLTEENDRLNQQLNADPTPALEDGSETGLLSRLTGIFS